MERRVTDGVTAGVNGDFSRFDNGQAVRRPHAEQRSSRSPPNAERASVGIRSDGLLDVRRVAFRATWRATVEARCSARSTTLRPPDGAALYTGAYGAEHAGAPGCDGG